MDLIGLLVCFALIGVGSLLGAPLIAGFLGSLAFGATSVASFGGTSIPVYVALAFVLAIAMAVRRNFFPGLVYVLRTQWLASLVCFIVIYAVLTSYILPRLFAGEVDVVVPVGAVVTRVPLAPVPGNMNQSVYFIVDGLVFFLIAVLLLQERSASIYRGLLFWAGLDAGMGLIDVLARLTGSGDILEPIRTSGYFMLTEQELGGFFRITGGFPEASAYAASAVQALGFSFVYWRNTHSRVAFVIAFTLLALLLFSTSSTGYVGLAALIAIYGFGAAVPVLKGRFRVHDIGLFLFSVCVVTAVLCAYLINQHSVDPFFDMIMNATVNKVSSSSAAERGSWNQLSIDALPDTYGLGVGLGSTRSSSWLISIFAQLGIIGGVGFMIAVGALISCIVRRRTGAAGELATSTSAATIAGLVAASAGGGNADPGLIFFIALAAAAASFASQSIAEQAPNLAPQKI